MIKSDIYNVELGDSTFSLDSLMTVCRVLSCSSDYLLFRDSISSDAWKDIVTKLQQLDLKYRNPVDKTLQGLIEAIVTAERKA